MLTRPAANEIGQRHRKRPTVGEQISTQQQPGRERLAQISSHQSHIIVTADASGGLKRDVDIGGSNAGDDRNDVGVYSERGVDLAVWADPRGSLILAHCGGPDQVRIARVNPPITD